MTPAERKRVSGIITTITLSAHNAKTFIVDFRFTPRRSASSYWVTCCAVVLCCAASLGQAQTQRVPPAPTMTIGSLFPTLTGEFLTGREARLPEAAAGQVTLVMLGFTYASRMPVEAWADHVKPAFAGLDRATFYEVPVIGGLARMGRWFIDSGMRRGTPKALHENVITVWGKTDEWKALASVTDDKAAYLFLLGRDGRILWRHTGGFKEAAFAEMLSLARVAARTQ